MLDIDSRLDAAGLRGDYSWGPEGPPPGITNAVRLNMKKKADIVEEDWEAQYDGALEEPQALETPQDLETLRDVVRNPNTPPEILAQLSEDKDVKIRLGIARNPNTPPEILAQLSTDEANYVRFMVAQNPNTSPEILAQLSEDENQSVRASVTYNPNVPKELLSIIREKDREFYSDNPEYMEEAGFPKDFKITDGYDFGATEGDLFAPGLTNVDDYVGDTAHPGTIIADLDKPMQLPPKPFISLKDVTPYLGNPDIVANNIDNALLPGGTVFISANRIAVDPYIDLLTAKGYQLVSAPIFTDETFSVEELKKEMENKGSIEHLQHRSIILTKPGQLTEETSKLNMKKKAEWSVDDSNEPWEPPIDPDSLEREFKELFPDFGKGMWGILDPYWNDDDLNIPPNILLEALDEGQAVILKFKGEYTIHLLNQFLGEDMYMTPNQALITHLLDSGKLHKISKGGYEVLTSDKAFESVKEFLDNLISENDNTQFDLPENLPPGIATKLNMKKALEIGGVEFPDTLKFKEETISPLDVETNVQELYKDAESFVINYIWSGLAVEGIISPDDVNVIQTDVDKVQFSSASSLVNQLMQEGWFAYLKLSYDTKLRADPQLQQQIFNTIQNAIIEGVV